MPSSLSSRRPRPPRPLAKGNTRPPRKAVPESAVSPALIHENYLRACESGMVMREADFRRRFHTLKHGLAARSVEESMAALRENAAEFRAFKELLEAAFAPGSLPEYEVLQRLADAIWRRLRLYTAAARWEADALRQCLGAGAGAGKLTTNETCLRAHGLMMLLLDNELLTRKRRELLSEVEHHFRALIRIRSGRKVRFTFISRQTRKEIKELEDDLRYWRAFDRIAEGGPEIEAAIDKIFGTDTHTPATGELQRRKPRGVRQSKLPPAATHR